jgi:hypothetical protein
MIESQSLGIFIVDDLFDNVGFLMTPLSDYAFAFELSVYVRFSFLKTVLVLKFIDSIKAFSSRHELINIINNDR